MIRGGDGFSYFSGQNWKALETSKGQGGGKDGFQILARYSAQILDDLTEDKRGGGDFGKETEPI